MRHSNGPFFFHQGLVDLGFVHALGAQSRKLMVGLKPVIPGIVVPEIGGQWYELAEESIISH